MNHVSTGTRIHPSVRPTTLRPVRAVILNHELAMMMYGCMHHFLGLPNCKISLWVVTMRINMM